MAFHAKRLTFDSVDASICWLWVSDKVKRKSHCIWGKRNIKQHDIFLIKLVSQRSRSWCTPTSTSWSGQSTSLLFYNLYKQLTPLPVVKVLDEGTQNHSKTWEKRQQIHQYQRSHQSHIYQVLLQSPRRIVLHQKIPHTQKHQRGSSTQDTRNVQSRAISWHWLLSQKMSIWRNGWLIKEREKKSEWKRN